MSNWRSKIITVDGIDIQVQASAEGITIGKTIDGVYSSDLLLTAEQVDALIEALNEGKATHVAASSGGQS